LFEFTDLLPCVPPVKYSSLINYGGLMVTDEHKVIELFLPTLKRKFICNVFAVERNFQISILVPNFSLTGLRHIYFCASAEVYGW
jgi:hypothetical protein